MKNFLPLFLFLIFVFFLGFLWIALNFSFEIKFIVAPEEKILVWGLTKEKGFQPASIFISTLSSNPAPPKEEPEVMVLAVGDVMLDRGVEYMAEIYGGDWNFIFEKIANNLEGADILFGNLEGPVSDKGYNVGSENSFRFNPSSIAALNFAGFTVFSLANNHMLDYTALAFLDTMERLKNAGILYAGAGKDRDEAFSLKIKEIKGTKIGFLAYTNLGPKAWQAETERPGMAWIDEAGIKNIEDYIKEIKEKKLADILFVSLHSGIEYSKNPSVFQEAFSHRAIDAGADVFLGHHPHIVQPLEEYGGGWIAYSLGNFVFDQGFSSETMEGMMLEIKIKDKKIIEVTPRAIKMNSFFQPYLAE